MNPKGCAGCAGAIGAGAVVLLVMGLAVLGGAVDDDQKNTAAIGGSLNSGQVPEEYRRWILKAAQQCADVTGPLIAAQIEAESKWNPKAQSPVGAEGLSQFMPGTWQSWGVDADGDGTADPYTPADAIMTQARYDCWVMKKVKSYKIDGDQTRLMLAGYNAGPDAVRQYGGIPPYPETQDYVTKIMGLIPKYTQAEEGADLDGTLGQRIAAQAQTQIGTPYSWGGGGINGPSTGIQQGSNTIGYDCSSLVQFAVYHASNGKITLPRTSQVQATQGKAVSRDNIRVGDLVAWSLNGGGFDHIGIYVGNGKFVHAPKTNDVVKTSDINEPYYANKPMRIRRIG